ncbi:uncharacterized protein BKA78DRAFT_322675 [Phyllosticta capitalensis]|uniref:uncharacterized protein n=1 Tax=Phyllosticta capitalensis TaxID=121624 RepID=UPI00312FCB99
MLNNTNRNPKGAQLLTSTVCYWLLVDHQTVSDADQGNPATLCSPGSDSSFADFSPGSCDIGPLLLIVRTQTSSSNPRQEMERERSVKGVKQTDGGPEDGWLDVPGNDVENAGDEEKEEIEDTERTRRRHEVKVGVERSESQEEAAKHGCLKRKRKQRMP